jgi:peptide/nickel transport system substrate-binding protein
MVILRHISALCAAVALLSTTAGTPASAQARPLRIGLVQQPNSLDPLHAVQFYENYLAEAIFSALCVIDDHGNPSPDLAREVPTKRNGGISSDGKTITYHLRDGVRWQDGAPLTSADVAFTLERMRDPKWNFPETTVYSIIDRLDTPDPQTVVLHLHSAWADATSELFVGGQDGSIVPEHVLRNVADPDMSSFESAPVGSGPYTVERWERGSRIVLRANPGYFRGKPHIDRIEIDFVPDQNVLALRVKDGELDFSPQMPQTFAAQLHDSPSLHVRAVPTYTDVELCFEVQHVPFDDARVRRALSLAIDRKRLTTSIYHGFALADDDMVPPQSPFHTADPNFRPSGNVSEAERLLDAAGWKLGPDGVRRKGGQPLSFALTTQSGYAAIAADAVQVQAMWSSIGADASLRPILSNMLYAPDGTMRSGNFVVAIVPDGYAASPDRADTLTTSGFPPGRNYSRYSDRDVDAWTAKGRVTDDLAQRRKIYAAISQRLKRDAPLPVLLWVELIYVYNGALSGLRPETVNSDFWNVYDWSLAS